MGGSVEMMKDGATLGMGCLLLIGFIALVVFAVISGANAFMDNRTTQLRAETDLVQAKMEREHQASVDWAHEFQIYVASLMAFSNDHTGLIAILSGVVGALLAVLVIVLVEMYWRKI